MAILKRRLAHILASVFTLLLLFSCNGKQKNANKYLISAEKAFNEANYSLAKLKIDSIKILFPEAFNEITKGFKLMQKVRLAENNRNIAFCDSMLEVNYKQLNTALTYFNYERDKQYQEFGYYIPKSLPLNNAFSQNCIRAAVGENSHMYIESVYTGQPIKHSKIKVSTKDGSYAESLSVTSDGLNYQFRTLEKSYEIVRYTGNDDNGISSFIFTFKDEPITLTFIGSSERSVTLPSNSKKAVSQSFELATLLKDIEDLKYEKGRSEALIKYLETKIQE